MNTPKLILVAFVSLSLMTAPLAAPLPDFADLHDQIHASVVTVVAYIDKNKNPNALRKKAWKKLLKPEYVKYSQGTGFFISSGGLLLTNAHVIERAVKFKVILTDGTEVDAELVWTQEAADIAMLKVDIAACVRVKIGDSDNLRVGQWVMAVGSPLGLHRSVTIGIISALKRDIGEIVPYIQTDAAVNPGNSGGPLFNMDGEVIGISSAMYTLNDGGSIGIAFAIPINEAMALVNKQLAAYGK